VIELGWVQRMSVVEKGESSNPLLLILQQMNCNSVIPKLVATHGGWIWVVVHRPLSIVPIFSTASPSHPISKHLILWALHVFLGNIRAVDPLHNVPGHHKPHPRHVVFEGVHASTRYDESIV